MKRPEKRMSRRYAAALIERTRPKQSLRPVVACRWNRSYQFVLAPYMPDGLVLTTWTS